MINNDTADTLSPTNQSEPISSHSHLQPEASTVPLSVCTRPHSVPSSSSLVQSDSIEDLKSKSQKVFAASITPNATTSTKSDLTPTQQQRIRKTRQEAIRRRKERLIEEGNEPHRKSNPSRNSFNRSPKSQLGNFL